MRTNSVDQARIVAIVQEETYPPVDLKMVLMHQIITIITTGENTITTSHLEYLDRVQEIYLAIRRLSQLEDHILSMSSLPLGENTHLKDNLLRRQKIEASQKQTRLRRKPVS